MGIYRGIYDDPNDVDEVWDSPHYNPHENDDKFGFEIEGSAQGSLGTGGLSGSASGSASGGGGAPAAATPRGSTWGSIASALRNRFLATQRAQPARPYAPPPAGPAPAVHPAVVAMYARRHAALSRTAKREMLLEPNKGSATKVERYTFSVSHDIAALATAQDISASDSPDTNIRPQRVTMNAPSPGFALISGIRVANVNVTVGGVQDAFDFNANGVGQSLDMPTLSPSNKITVTGTYTGLVPSPLSGTGPYTFVASFKGPASIVA